MYTGKHAIKTMLLFDMGAVDKKPISLNAISVKDTDVPLFCTHYSKALESSISSLCP